MVAREIQVTWPDHICRTCSKAWVANQCTSHTLYMTQTSQDNKQVLQVFATASFGEIRIWNIHSCREMLRIKVANLQCACVAFMADGGSIISGWSDGKIRAFGPQSGKLLYTINDAHHKAVTAVVGCSDSQRIVSGGEEGTVRVWQVCTISDSFFADVSVRSARKLFINSIDHNHHSIKVPCKYVYQFYNTITMFRQHGFRSFPAAECP